jgi:hypothetical protein
MWRELRAAYRPPTSTVPATMMTPSPRGNAGDLSMFYYRSWDEGDTAADEGQVVFTPEL